MKLSFLLNEGVEFCNCPRKAGKRTILGSQFPQPKPSTHSGSSAKGYLDPEARFSRFGKVRVQGLQNYVYS